MSLRVVDGGARKSTRPPSAYKMVARGDAGEIYLYGVIGEDFWGDGITAKQFSEDLKSLRSVSTIDVRINSEGGDVFAGRTMYTLLRDHNAKIVVHVDGLAASAASFIAMAGEEIHIGEGAFMMIHNAWSVAIGDAFEMRRRADLLDSVSATIRDTYAARSGQSIEQIAAWMNEETWMTGSECVDRGFADRLVEDLKVAAKVQHGEVFKNMPAKLRPRRASVAASVAALRESIT